MSELERGETYLVREIKQVSTKYGLKAVVVIDGDFQVFLPNRVSKALEENGNLFDQLAEKANKYKLFILYLYFNVNKCK